MTTFNLVTDKITRQALLELVETIKRLEKEIKKLKKDDNVK